jgi:hypothetical protein
VSVLEELRKVHELRGDTYSSYEVIGVIGRAADEIDRLRAINTELVAMLEWLDRKGGLGSYTHGCIRAALAKAKEQK